MRVKIGPYVNWIGPYQIADKIPFVSEETRETIGDWLSNTWVSDLCNWYHSKKKRKINVHIDKYDTWSMDHTLGYIILPMLKQLKATKHGSPIVDDEDLPPQMRYSHPKVDENGWDMGDNWVHYKWDWVLNEMIWAFEQELDENWEDQFHHGEAVYEWNIVSGKEEDDTALYEMKQLNPDHWYDFEGYQQYQARITNGFRLFGKYYQGLWD